MRLNIRAHFDGRAIIPDEPVSIPPNTPLNVLVDTDTDVSTQSSKISAQQALDRILSRPVRGLNIPSESLRRENIYEE